MSGKHPPESAPELAVRLIIALGDFAAFLYFLNVHITTSATVPVWVFVMLLAVLGAMLGRDVVRRYQGGTGGV